MRKREKEREREIGEMIASERKLMRSNELTMTMTMSLVDKIRQGLLVCLLEIASWFEPS